MSIDMSGFEHSFANETGIAAMPSLNAVATIEPQLSNDMDNVMFERICDLRDRIADLTDTIEYLRSFLHVSDDELEELDRMRISLQEVLAEIRKRTSLLNDNQKLIKNQISPYKRSLEESQREWFRLMAELEAQQRERNNRRQLDLLTENAPWRDRALPHQYEGAYRLSSVKRGILGDKMGLGKTLQAIMTIDMLKAYGEAKKVLIFCPKPVLDGFERDFKKFSPDQFVFILNQAGSNTKSHVLDVVRAMPVATILTNYEVWRKDKTIIDQLIACQFDTIVLDEAHVMKNANSGNAKGIKRIVHAENKCYACGGLTFGSGCPACGAFPEELYQNRSIKNCFPMTGTAILNRPQDLFPLLHLVDDQAFPDEQAFLRDFCQRICTNCRANYGCTCAGKPNWVWTFRTGGEEALLKRLGMRFTARTRDSAGVVMPPQEIKHHYFDLDPEEYPKQAEFNRLLRDQARLFFAREDKTITQFETLGWYTRMRQSAIWPDGIRVPEKDDDGRIIRYWQPSVGESILMDRGEEIIREGVENGNRIIVFCKFKTALIEMERRLRASGIPLVRYDGDLSDDARREAQHDFDFTLTNPADAKFKVMLAQYDSAKVGLNLHGAQEVVLLDREWNPAMEQQAIDRVRRIGSVFDTIVHILHCAGTATDLMDAIQEYKLNMVEGFEAENERMQKVMRDFLGDDK